MSDLDVLTLADSIKNKQIIWLVVLFTFQFSIVAYYMVYKFCQQMSSFEFQPNQQYIDSFVSTHTIMIRGVNQNIGVEEADSLIRKVFEERFGPKQVIAVSTIRETDNV